MNNAKLLQSVHDSKIKDAIFQMDKFKAPGPDGFGAAFLKIISTLLKRKFALQLNPFLRRGSY